MIAERLMEALPDMRTTRESCAFQECPNLMWTNVFHARIYTKYGDVSTTILASPGEIQIHLRAWSSDKTAMDKILDEMVERITLALGENVFTHRAQTLEYVVADALTLNHATISTAESCTGGLLAERLTRVPGSSNYFLGVSGKLSSNALKSA